MRAPPALLPLAAVALAAAAAGCGGPRRADAVNVATTWLKAVRAGEERAACNLMAPGAARAIPAPGAAPGAACPDVLAAFRRWGGDEQIDAMLETGLRARGRDGARRLRLVAEGTGSALALRYRDGHWAVTGGDIPLVVTSRGP